MMQLVNLQQDTIEVLPTAVVIYASSEDKYKYGEYTEHMII